MIYTLKKFWIYFFCFFIVILFLFLRWYKIDQSFFFHNDTGRDYLVLSDWHQTWKPPLLGPQNSALPLNQSAVYFYFFFPVFVFTGHSIFTTQITLSLMYVSAFAVGSYWLRKKTFYLSVLLFAAVLFAVHPQFVLQNRYVWNPSFVSLFLVAAFFFFTQLQNHFSRKIAALFCMSCALAIGMNFSAIPAVVSLVILVGVMYRKKLFQFAQILGGMVVAHLVVFAPFLIFELKYKFQVTSRLLAQHTFSSAGEKMSFSEKIYELSSYILPAAPYAVFGILGIVLIGFFLIYKKRKEKPEAFFDEEIMSLAQLLFLFLFTSFLTLFSPVRLEAHYIFGSVTFFFLLITTLPRRVAISIIFILMIIWLQPKFLSSYFVPAPRTVETLQSCFTDFCAKHKDPTFVSVQADFHSYHVGPEFRYLMKEHGCSVKGIETEPESAQRMAVVVDGGEYEHGKTSYGELTMFGESNETEVATCAANLRIHVLQKK